MAPRRAGGSSAVKLTLLLLLFVSPSCVEAQSRVFTTCEALAGGLESSVISQFSSSIRSFCRSAERLFSSDSDDDAETGTVVDDEEEEDDAPDEGDAVPS